MRQVTFDAVQRGPVLRAVKKNACVFFTILGVHGAGILNQNTAHVSSRLTAAFPFQTSRKARSACICHPASHHPTHCFYTSKYWVCNVSTTGLSRRRYGPVTFVAQACNAKNIFTLDIVDRARLCSCNVCRAGHLANKFPKNRVVSTAGTHSLNCIVYDRHHLATSPNRARLVGMAAPITTPRISWTRRHLTAGGAR